MALKYVPGEAGLYGCSEVNIAFEGLLFQHSHGTSLDKGSEADQETLFPTSGMLFYKVFLNACISSLPIYIFLPVTHHCKVPKIYNTVSL